MYLTLVDFRHFISEIFDSDSDAKEATDYLSDETSVIDIIIIDLSLLSSDFDGFVKLLDAIENLQAEPISVVLSSGRFNREIVDAVTQKYPQTIFIAKPYDLQDLKISLDKG